MKYKEFKLDNTNICKYANHDGGMGFLGFGQCLHEKHPNVRYGHDECPAPCKDFEKADEFVIQQRYDLYCWGFGWENDNPLPINYLYKCDNCGNPTNNNQGSIFEKIHLCTECLNKQERLKDQWRNIGTTTNKEEIICPYCGHINTEDTWLINYDEFDGVECKSCHKRYDVFRTPDIKYSIQRSVCDMPENFGGE